MILEKFAVTNFRGFSQRIEWDLSSPGNYAFNPDAIKEGVVKNGIIYGPNGSGKSNFSLALFDMVNHLTQKMRKADYYDNFAYAGNANSPVSFEYLFKNGTDHIAYLYAKRSNGSLCWEELKVNDKQVFMRTDNKFEIDEEQFPMHDTTKAKLRNNANNISIVNYLVTSFPLPQGHYLLELQHFADTMLWFRCLNVTEFIGLDATPTVLEEYIIKHNYTEDFQRFLRDVSGQEFEFVTPHPTDKVLLCRYGDNVIPFNKIASTGTQSLRLLYYWMKKMNAASFVFIDEFDAFYHYRLSYNVCKELFRLNCQLFLSSHNTYLMTNDLLRPDCNFILQDNVIKPLQKCTSKELRFGHNMEKLYRGKAFSV
ncbi:MAG: AAA family ATPase [Prevotella sp.]|jgi:AAA15 family ATPase/GTPase